MLSLRKAKYILKRILSMPRRFEFAAAVAVAALSLWYFFSLPDPLCKNPYSTVLKANHGELLSGTIAADGQWRFPESDSVPSKYVDALITFEDKRFFSHPGVDLLALGRAFRQNMLDRSIVSG